MSEDKDLLSRISQLAGHINLHKGQTPSAGDSITPTQTWTPKNRWLPPSRGYSYDHGRGVGRGLRGAGRAISRPYRNRTLVLKKTTVSHGSDTLNSANSISIPGQLDENQRSVVSPSTTTWVSRRDRHAQLINSSIYDKETMQRNKAIEQTRQQQAFRKDQRERLKINKHLQAISNSAVSSVPTATSPMIHKILISGLHFQVCDGGSRLLRIRNDFDSTRPTPKRATVGGVTFYRSKNGNLYRSGLVKGARRKNAIKPKIPLPCKIFSTTGQCPKGPFCSYLHDPARVAICQTYLLTGECPARTSCDLSHDSTPERVPACVHFLHGKCSKKECRYAHVQVNPTALTICRDFAILGFCAKGALCADRHVFECPEYASTGNCKSKQCRLRHVDRAGQIRQHANKPSVKPYGQTTDASDLSSEEDEDEDDVAGDSQDIDSDGLEDEVMFLPQGESNNILSEQSDFVHF